jgi:N-acetylneuraminate lyase
MKNLGSIFAALLTPFEDDGTISHDRIGPLVDFIISQGVHGVYASGSTGESVLQSRDDRETHLIALAEHARGKCTLIAHVGAAATQDAVHLAKIANEYGYNALSAVPPYYYRHSFEAIHDYYAAISQATDLPLTIYNIPVLSGADLSTEKLLKLLDIPNVEGVKFTSQDLFQFGQLRKKRPEKAFYFGTDEMFLGAVAMGSDGGIGSTYNLIGRHYVEIEKAVAANDIEGARKLQSEANDMIEILIRAGVVPGLKYAMGRIGVTVGPCREPFRPVSDTSKAEIDAWLEAHDFSLTG